jgi:hypothetical protein
MFPHACGTDFAERVKNGADPKAVVPDDFVITHGGTGPIDAPGTILSGTTGPTLEAAAAALPHGQLRATTAGAIRAGGGTVEWIRETSRRGTLNPQHVNIIEGGPTSFSEVQSNPVPRSLRIDGRKK